MLRTLFAVLFSIAVASPLVGQTAGGAEKIEVRTYRVSDLVMNPANYEIQHVPSPTGQFSVPDRIHLGQDDFGEFGGGGTRATQRGPLPTGLRLTAEQLIEILISNVEADSWDDVGGSGHISFSAGILVISQTPRVHTVIQSLLEDLRRQGAVISSLTIRAYWLRADDVSPLMLDHRRLDRAKLAKEIKANGAVAQLSCFDSQTVHLVAGSERSTVSGVIPVVGQLDRTPSEMQQRIPDGILAQSDDMSSVGYQPITSTNSVGGMLQVNATLDADRKSAIVDVHSTVSRLKDGITEHDFNGITNLEKVAVITQRFKTSLRLPTNVPVLIGGSTLEPMKDGKADDHQQLFLVMEVIPD